MMRMILRRRMVIEEGEEDGDNEDGDDDIGDDGDDGGNEIGP